jgi:hypothetical protein
VPGQQLSTDASARPARTASDHALGVGDRRPRMARRPGAGSRSRHETDHWAVLGAAAAYILDGDGTRLPFGQTILGTLRVITELRL